MYADVLRARLLDEQPQRVHLLHRQAGAWYEENGEPAEAVDHAVRGEDFARAARLVEQAMPAMRRNRQDAELRRWLEALPDELVRDSPLLTIGLVGARMVQGQLDGVEERLQDAERWLAANATAPLAGPLRTLPSSIAMFRAGLARMRGDVAGTIEHASRAHEFADETDHLERGSAAALLGLAHWSSGQLDDAHRCYGDAISNLSQAGHLSDVLGCTVALADMEVAQGDLVAAAASLERGLRAAREAAHVPRGTADMHVGLAALHVERQELAAALEHLRQSDALGEHADLPQNAYRSRVTLAQVRQAQGAWDESMQLLEEADRVYDSDYSPDVRPVPALIARAWIARGRLDEARDWARSRDLGTDDELTYLREFEHLTLARLALAEAQRGDSRAAAELGGFLDRLLQAAQLGRRPGAVLEIHVLRALLAQARDDQPAAHEALQAALELAEPQRYVRTLTEHGAPVLRLLRSMTADAYALRLIATFDDRAEAGAPSRQPLPERLSDRELEVLQLLASELGGPDIARHLVVSVHTVRTHTKSIYAKLGVNSRRSAVNRARELELLSRGG
jgi:LuxR family maltose regulon positive regulatory protein